MWGDEDDLSPHHQAGAPGRPQPVHAARLQLRPAHTCQEAALPPQQGQDRVRGEAGAVLGRRGTDHCTPIFGPPEQKPTKQKSRKILGKNIHLINIRKTYRLLN